MKDTTQKFTIKERGRLDIALTALLEISRSQAQKLIAEGAVLVNKKVPKTAGLPVRVGEVIEVQGAKKKAKETKEKKAVKKMADTALLKTIKIIAETPEYVVLEKPAGLLVHATMANEPDTLVSWLIKKYPKIKKVGDDTEVRPGIVHRLDKEASGLIVVAKTQAMFDHLKDQFKNRTVEKEYMALVHGKTSKDWDEIKFPIARGETFDRMAARPFKHHPVEGEKEALTEFIVEKRFANCTLLRVTLHTGRMHQIRVHMLAYNHPLVGDPLYQQRKRKRNLDEKLGRMFLHSVKLGFTDLDGKKQVFETKLPEKLSEFVKTLPQ